MTIGDQLEDLHRKVENLDTRLQALEGKFTMLLTAIEVITGMNIQPVEKVQCLVGKFATKSDKAV